MSKIATVLGFAAAGIALLVLGISLESSIVGVALRLAENRPILPIALFFVAVNLNVLLLFLFVFLTFRNGVKLAVDRKKDVFGSRLRTKLVTSFLFFSLLPTAVLLYMSTKFVNSNLNSLLPGQMLAGAAEDIAQSISVLKLGYYVMLCVLTLLIMFCASWLGITIARELTTPILVLASATEAVSQGRYDVQIDDIVSDDEIGSLARSFRNMVSDLQSAKSKADSASTTLRKQAESLREKSEYNAFLLENVNVAVIGLTERGRVESWNQQAESLFGLGAAQALGRPLEDCVEDRFAEAVTLALGEIAHGAGNKMESDFVGKVQGSPRQLRLAVSAVRSGPMRPKHVLLVDDVTELAKAQRMLAWREVASRVAHEIKNPLTPIKLGAQRLQRRFGGRFPDEEKEIFQECTQVILSSIESIRGLVDEFVQYARLPQAKLVHGNLLETVRLAVASFRDNAEGVEVIMESPDCRHSDPAVGILALFDPDQMLRCVHNLVSNAVAASAEAGVQAEEAGVEAGSAPTPAPVRVRVASPAELEGWIRIDVIDSGIGLSSEKKARLFEPYFSTKKSGTGLGLVIARQIMKEHRGRISLRDNAPRGCVFSLELPRA